MTSINLSGIRIDEPVATATDLLVSAVCLYAYLKLRKANRPGKTQLYFRFYFLLMSIGTFIGGLIGHAFLYALSFPWKLPGWVISMLAIAMIERSSIERARPLISAKTGRFFLIMNVMELLTILIVTMTTLNFKWVEFHSGYGLLGVVLPFHSYCYYKTRDKGSLMIIVAVAIVSIAALIFINKISIHTWFNHLDISHTIMAIGGYVFYRAALLLRD